MPSGIYKRTTNRGWFKKGEIPFIKGKKNYFYHTKEAKIKIGKASRINPTGFKKGHIGWNKGKKGLQVAWNKGKKMSKEYNCKNKESHLGQIAWNKGISCSEIIKKKISESLNKSSKVLRGEKSHLWKGGISLLKGYDSFIGRRRKIRKKENGGNHTFGEWKTLKAQYNWTCPCCKMIEPDIKLTEDHIIPLFKGGSDNIENIQPLCQSCNSKKNTKIIYYKI